MTQQKINNASMLPVGTLLRGLYRIDKHLSSGGFGNTYLAIHIEFNERYAIKEFFMKGVTQRDGNQTTVSVSNSENEDTFLQQKEKFKKEARRLRKLQNEHLVKVYDLFDENGTAYYVMDFVDGVNLSEHLNRTGRPMTESEVRLILPQILDALKAVHNEGFCHLDIKPSNIMLEKGGNIKLVDFGASKQLGVNGTLTTNAPTAFAQTPGYAPREQMEQNLDKIGPWTDVYALGATLYNLLTNKRPPLPTDIDDDISQDKHLALPMPADISKQMKDLVLWLMQTNRIRRAQSIAEVQKRLTADKPESQPQYPKADPKVGKEEGTVVAGEGTIVGVPPQKPVPGKNPPRQPKEPEKNEEPSNSNPLAFIVGGLFIFFVIIFSVAMCRSNGEVETPPSIDDTIEDELVDSAADLLFNGYSEMSYDDGSSYKGHFKDGSYHGQGTFTWANGDKYEGEWVNGSKTKGTYTWPEKRKGYMYKYIGEFKNNEFEGKGTAYYVGGDTESGIWKNGKFVGTETEQDLTPLERKVVGKHLMELFWIGGDQKFGSVNITKEADGRLKCVGSQYSDDRIDYVIMDGYIEIVNANHLVFKGKISIRVHYINSGKEYVRYGAYDFKAYNGRKYWRLQQMETPSGETDNLDIFFAKEK